MFIDLSTQKLDHGLRADIVIVGSGPAGLALAERLQSLGRDVLLIESGAFEYSDRAQDLNTGEDALGRPYYLKTSRFRVFGGTSLLWGGWCKPLDPVDFSERNWIKHSGWPISSASLTTYYTEAAVVCELPGTHFETEKWSELRGQRPLSLQGEEFSTAYFQLSPPTRFGTKYRRSVEKSAKITAVLNATATAVQLESNGSSCHGLSVAGPDGKEFTVVGSQYVLACGAIENARLLLISDDVHPNGVGNDNDLVGRFFMDHPTFTSGAFIPINPKVDIGLYIYDSLSKFRGLGTIAPTPALVQKLSSINSNIELQPSFEGMGNCLSQLKSDYWSLTNRVKRGEVSDDFGGNLSTFFSMIGNGTSYAWSSLRYRDRNLLYANLRHHLECTPNSQSRVTINKRSRDRFGRSRPRLDWRINPGDIEGWMRVQEALALAFGKSGLGRMRIDYVPSKGVESLNIESSWHHMGTTRMHRDPRQGVIDENCRVHGVSNLFIAGSSVFPTSGHANPTLTIVALALRLGDHLGRKDKQ